MKKLLKNKCNIIFSCKKNQHNISQSVNICNRKKVQVVVYDCLIIDVCIFVSIKDL